MQASDDPRPTPPVHAGTVFAYVLVFVILAFLWVFPTVSLGFLLDREPVEITVTDCYDDKIASGKGREPGCDGTWTLADGTTGAGRFTKSRENLEPGDVVDGVHVGGRAARDALPWILDVALIYPAAIVSTGVLVMVVRDLRRRKTAAAAGTGETEKPAAGVKAAGIFGKVLLVCAYVFLWGYPTYSALAVLTADPVAITVTGCRADQFSSRVHCHGEWILADGSHGDGSVENRSDATDDGDVIEGLSIGDRVVHTPRPWIFDMVFCYPAAILLTLLHRRAVLRRRRRPEPAPA